MKIRLSSIAYRLFVPIYVIYIIANTYYLKNAFPELYYLKHISVLVLFIVGVFALNKIIGKSEIGLLMCFLPVGLPFLFQGKAGVIVGIQYYIFLISTMVVGKMWLKKITIRRIIVLQLIFLIPALTDYLFNNFNFFYNEYYVRGRLLLGFFHPKEAGISLLIPALIARWYFLQKNVKRAVLRIYDLLLLIIFYFISSRNALFFYINSLLLSFLFRKIGFARTILILVLLIVFIGVFLINAFSDEINLLLSNRLDRWITADITLFGSGGAMDSQKTDGLASAYHIDNYYLEYIISNGIVPAIYFFCLLAALVFFIGKRIYYGVPINSILIPFLIVCMFDSGMFSSGNLLTLFVWSYVFAGVFEMNKERMMKAT